MFIHSSRNIFTKWQLLCPKLRRAAPNTPRERSTSFASVHQTRGLSAPPKLFWKRNTPLTSAVQRLDCGSHFAQAIRSTHPRSLRWGMRHTHQPRKTPLSKRMRLLTSDTHGEMELHTFATSRRPRWRIRFMPNTGPPTTQSSSIS